MCLEPSGCCSLYSSLCWYHCSLRLMAGATCNGEMRMWRLQSRHDLQGPWFNVFVWRWILLGLCRCMVPPPPEVLSPQSCNHSRLHHVTAPCSNWPVTLSALGGEGLAFVGLPWRLGHLMRTSTLWLMTSLSPSDILQMDNLLHHSHTRTTIHKNKGTELGVVRPHWIEDSFPFCLFSPWINKWQVDFSSNASF